MQPLTLGWMWPWCLGEGISGTYALRVISTVLLWSHCSNTVYRLTRGALPLPGNERKTEFCPQNRQVLFLTLCRLETSAYKSQWKILPSAPVTGFTLLSCVFRYRALYSQPVIYFCLTCSSLNILWLVCVGGAGWTVHCDRHFVDHVLQEQFAPLSRCWVLSVWVSLVLARKYTQSERQ